MNNFLLLWLSLSLSGSLVAVTLIVLKPFLGQFSKRWQYYIWLLVILRLLIPISPDVSIIGGLFQQAETYFASDDIPMENMQESNNPVLSDSVNVPIVVNKNHKEAPTTVAAFTFRKNHVWGTLWFIVAIALLLRKVYGYRQLLKALKKESKISADVQLLTALELVCKEMKIRKKILVYTNSLVRAPMLVGVLKPTIIVPSKIIPATELMYIFRHELTHYRRMDFYYKWITEVAVCLHWFNPFVYWVRKQINRDCEFSCDEAVVVHLENTERKNYGDTLLNSIEVNNLGRKHVVSLSLNEDAHLIKERLCAIMKYKRKSKFVVVIAAILTTVLFFGTVFCGTYTVMAKEPSKKSADVKPIRISGDKEISSGGKISLGSQKLVSGTECKVSLTWSGKEKLTILCTSSKGKEKRYSVENGKVTTFQIKTSGKYTLAVKNENDFVISNVNGSITFNKDSKSKDSKNIKIAKKSANPSTTKSIIYENVEMRIYEGEDGHPYIHNTKTNRTKKGIASYDYGMLAFDKNGNPLKISWWSLDTDAESTYFYLVDTSTKISPNETYDVYGGWSIDILGNDSAADKIAYVLYCDKKIVFDDGTVWKNADFKKWRTTYEGKKIDVKILDNYYPYEQKIEF